MSNDTLLLRYKNSLTALKRSSTYYQRMKDFISYINDHQLGVDEVDEDTIYEYLAFKEFSANSINTFIKAGKHFYAFINLSSGHNPFGGFKQVRVEKKIPTYMVDKELLRGINYCIATAENISPYKIMAVCYFLFYTGIRKAEMLNIKRVDIDLESDPICITVRTPTKYNKERITCFPTKFKSILTNYFDKDPEQINAFNLERWHLEYIVKLFDKAFPDKHISIHTFRHSFAKHLIRNRVDVTIVSKLLGHSNIETTLIYVNPDEDMIKEVYKENT